MHIAVIGAAGMIGRKLTDRLVADGRLGETAVDALTLADVIAPPTPTGWTGSLRIATTDLATAGAPVELLEDRPDVIFHLAAVVSGEAETDFDKGYRVNLDGTRAALDAIRAAHTADGYRPRLVFTSSLAVYGPPFPDSIPDNFHVTPLTSYGAQKAVGELLLNDYTRRGFVDGIGVRLPTICIRPGEPNRAASGFFSSILREPLVGREAVLPVPETIRHWFASPRAAVGFLVHAATIDGDAVGPNRVLVMPGLSATVADEIEALRTVAGENAVGLIRREPDPMITRIVEGWAPRFDARRARELGFVAESSFEEIIRVHLEDELGVSTGPRQLLGEVRGDPHQGHHRQSGSGLPTG
jgi:nucleoside-diphosphate-sugar epimerase